MAIDRVDSAGNADIHEKTAPNRQISKSLRGSRRGGRSTIGTEAAKLECMDPRRRRIVVTGGPGGGKTTAADLFRREIGPGVVVVPEAATLLFTGGFPRSPVRGVLESAQAAIYHVQRQLEDAQAALFPGRILLCDRGTVDGACYWPGQPQEFFRTVGSTLEAELQRYDGVLFFESAAVGGLATEGNPVRTESIEEAVSLDRRLRNLWSRHPRFVFVPHEPSFFRKISTGLAGLVALVRELTP